jgi:GNAT superfamily N-acetyltransferase
VTPTIRAAVASDWAGAAAVLAELGRPDARGKPEEEGHRSIFVSYLEREDVDAFVAEEDGQILGFVNVEYRDRLNRETPQAWIPELIVRETARGRGIGKDLLSRAESAANARGCWSMALESATWRGDAHRFYEREGWEHKAKAFVQNLSE